MLQAAFIFRGVRQSLRDDTNNENAVGRVGNSSYKSIFKGVGQSPGDDTNNEKRS
jgi:hypothetical protein